MINLTAGDISESETLEFYDNIVTEDSKGIFPTLNDQSKLFWVENSARLSRDGFWRYCENSQKLIEIENSKNALEPIGDPKWPQVTLLQTLFDISRRLNPISLIIVLKNWSLRLWLNRNYYVMWSRDVKTEVTINHFRFEIPRKHLIMISLSPLQKSISSRNSP